MMKPTTISMATDNADDDIDGDGLSNTEEKAHGTNPYDPDTDNGGVDDGLEVMEGQDPLDPVDDFGDFKTTGGAAFGCGAGQLAFFPAMVLTPMALLRCKRRRVVPLMCYGTEHVRLLRLDASCVRAHSGALRRISDVCRVH
jgi:hypothetical protein